MSRLYIYVCHSTSLWSPMQSTSALGARRPSCLTLTLTHLLTGKSLEMTYFYPPADAVRVTLSVEKLPTSHGWNWQQILYQHSWWAQLFSYHFTELMGADGNLPKQDPKTPVAQSNTWISQVRSQTRWTKEKNQYGLSPFASHQQPASTTISPLTVAKAMPWCLGSRALSCYYTIWKCSIFPIIFSVTPLTGSPDLPDH